MQKTIDRWTTSSGMERQSKIRTMVGVFHSALFIINNHLTYSIVKTKLEDSLRQTYSQWQSQIHHFQKTFSLLSLISNRHPGQSLPSVTQKQLSQNFIPLLPNTVPSHPNFVAIQRVFSLPFRVTISMSHTQPTQKTTSFWKPSFLSRSVDEALTEFEKLSQEQIEQLVLHKSSILFSLSF